MDPNETLKAIRLYRQNLSEYLENGIDPYNEDVQNLLDNLRSLDHWLSMGGFLPEAWETQFDYENRRNRRKSEETDKAHEPDKSCQL